MAIEREPVAMKARCLCDKSAIDINGEAKLSMLCHCEKCRMVSGLAGAYVLFSEDDVEVTGDFIVFQHGTPNGDTTTNYTCKGCGVTVMRKASTTPGMIMVSLGCLDKPDTFTPDYQIWTAQKLPWLIDDGSIASSSDGAAVAERLQLVLSNLDNE